MGEFTLRVLADAGSDADELGELTSELYDELSVMDAAVTLPGDSAAPESAKGMGSVADWLLVQFATLDGLRTAVGVVCGWASRTGRTVEVSINGDVMKLTAVTSAQQDKIIDAWLARHSTSG